MRYHKGLLLLAFSLLPAVLLPGNQAGMMSAFIVSFAIVEIATVRWGHLKVSDLLSQQSARQIAVMAFAVFLVVVLVFMPRFETSDLATSFGAWLVLALAVWIEILAISIGIMRE